MDTATDRHLQTGRWAEKNAPAFLRRSGLKLLEKNYRCTFGEIDLIMQDGENLVFVEVCYRNSSRFGGALASVDYHKQRSGRATAEHYLQEHPRARNKPCRFDVLGVTEQSDQPDFDWITNAF
ncbi:MAG: YraN family protein [Gammaproteobacteria bacterium]|nr:YraN family protein [Gammaproteobacteria bacterium]